MDQINQSRGARHRNTRDLAFAGFAHMRGLKILRADQCNNRRAREYTFTFDDPDGVWEALHVSFVNSEAAAYDHSIRSLKKLCHRGIPE